jgi:hypothetical protein
VNVRILDPVTGNILDETAQPFTVQGTEQQSATPAIVSDEMENAIVIRRSDSGFLVANSGYQEATVELKVWTEMPDGSVAQVLSAGANSSMVLPAGTVITVDSLPSSGTLRAKILDAVSGNLLAEE